MESWQQVLIKFVRSYWMPISAFFGIPFVALANKYRRSDIDFTFLHALDVTNLSFSLWASFAVSYFTVYCTQVVLMRFVSIYIDSRIDARASKFLKGGKVTDPWNISRYEDKVDELRMDYREAYRTYQPSCLLMNFWAVFLLWFAIWDLPIINFVLVIVLSYFLFLFEDSSDRLRDRQYRKSSYYQATAHLTGSRQERIAAHQKELEDRDRLAIVEWPKVLLRLMRILPNLLQLNVNWKATETKIIAAVCLLIVALNFGSGSVSAAREGPDRIFRVGNQVLCGKLMNRSFYGYHLYVGANERLVFLPQVSSIEALAKGHNCDAEEILSTAY